MYSAKVMSNMHEFNVVYSEQYVENCDDMLWLMACAGGGYTKHNVARCWTAETAVLLDQQIAEELPPNDYYDYYAPDYRHG